MDLTIGGRDYKLQFGILFNHTLDEFYKQEVEGMQFGMGVEMAYVYLSNGNVGGVYNVIKAATDHLKQKPSNNDLASFIEETAKADKGLDKICDSLIKEMKDSPFLGFKIKKMEKEQKLAAKQS